MKKPIHLTQMSFDKQGDSLPMDRLFYLKKHHKLFITTRWDKSIKRWHMRFQGKSCDVSLIVEKLPASTVWHGFGEVACFGWEV